MTMIWVQQFGVWRQVDRKIDSALVNRAAALRKLKAIRADNRTDGTAAALQQKNMLHLIALKASLEAGLGDVSSKETLL